MVRARLAVPFMRCGSAFTDRRLPVTTRSWIRKLFASRTHRTIRKAPARRQLRLELLEDRVVLSGGLDPIGRILPLHLPGVSPYGVSQTDLPAAEVTGLYH